MQKIFSLFLLLSVVLFATGCSPKTTAAATEGSADWAARAAAYKKNPDALRQLVEGCEVTEKQLVTTRQQLDQYRTQSGSNTQALTDAQTQAAAAREEANQLRQQLVEAQNALATAQAAPQNDRVDTDQVAVAGVIFQVQLGAYAQNTVDPNLATGNALDLQDQNGLQKVVVSQFRTYANAAKLRDRLKQMGVKDAFVVAKNNGQRISVPEALQMTGQN
ncbi:MAG: hypothetical protein AAGF89_10420 [Bacteroidota bacterium]